MINWIGWVATGVFAVSYFCKQPKMLRMVQAIAALMWVTYGFLIGAMPVVVANVIVALAALYSSFGPVRSSPTT
jgi:inner membrane protein